MKGALALLIAAVAFTAAEVTPSGPDSNVVTLGASDFDEVVTPEQLWLVKFYAPWCGHCKRLAPVLDSISTDAALVGNAKIARVDCTVHTALCKRFDVHGYPSVKVLHEGHVWEHKGARNRPAISALLARMQRPAVKDLATVEALQDALALASHEDSALFFYGGAESAGAEGGAELKSSFFAAARSGT